jgi:hypothetical protein
LADVVGDSENDDEAMGLNPCTVSSLDLTDSSEFHVNGRRNWRSLLNKAKVAIKSFLCCPKSRSIKPGDAPVADAKRASQLALPLHRAWYKERDGWRWVERDVDEVLAELRKLQ